MQRDKSLDVDLETIGYGEKAQQVARIAVVGVEGCTRDGRASTITADCRSSASLEREVDRLREELADALARGAVALGGEAAERSPATRSRERVGAEPAPTRVVLQLPAGATVADVMTREVKTVSANDTLETAKALMDAGGFRHLVAVDAENAVEGVLSHRDLFFGPLAWSLGQGRAGYEKLLASTRVKDAMQAEVATIDASAPLQAAAAQLVERKIGCLPVVEADRLIGVLTESDLVALIAAAGNG